MFWLKEYKADSAAKKLKNEAVEKIINAIHLNDKALVSQLIQQDVDINHQHNGITPLMMATFFCCQNQTNQNGLEIAEMLIDCGASPESEVTLTTNKPEGWQKLTLQASPFVLMLLPTANSQLREKILRNYVDNKKLESLIIKAVKSLDELYCALRYGSPAYIDLKQSKEYSLTIDFHSVAHMRLICWELIKKYNVPYKYSAWDAEFAIGQLQTQINQANNFSKLNEVYLQYETHPALSPQKGTFGEWGVRAFDDRVEFAKMWQRHCMRLLKSPMSWDALLDLGRNLLQHETFTSDRWSSRMKHLDNYWVWAGVDWRRTFVEACQQKVLDKLKEFSHDSHFGSAYASGIFSCLHEQKFGVTSKYRLELASLEVKSLGLESLIQTQVAQSSQSKEEKKPTAPAPKL